MRAVVAVAMISLLLIKVDCQDDSRCLEEMWATYPSGQLIDWPSPCVEANYSETAQYIPVNILPTRFQMCGDTVFIITPRYRNGVPSTLNKFRVVGSMCMVKMQPWPCLEVNSISERDGIINAVDLALDEDGILWLLDIGETNTLGPPPYNFNPMPQTCLPLPNVQEPPRILGFHISNASLEYRFELCGLINEDSRLQYIQVEKTCTGQKFVYVTDAGTRSVLMFDVEHGRGYRVLLPPCLEGGELCKDILYMTLVKSTKCRPTSLLFLTYLTSRKMFVLPTEKLWKKKRCLGELMLVGAKPGPMVILGADDERRIFFRMRGESDVFLWNVDEEFTTCNFRLVRATCCRRATHVSPGYLSLVWLLESNFHDFVRGTTGCVGASAKLLPLMNQTGDPCYEDCG